MIEIDRMLGLDLTWSTAWRATAGRYERCQLPPEVRLPGTVRGDELGRPGLFANAAGLGPNLWQQQRPIAPQPSEKTAKKAALTKHGQAWLSRQRWAE